MKISKRVALLPILFFLVFSSVSYASSSSVKATATVVKSKCEKIEITIISPQDKYYNIKNIPLTFKIKGTASWIKYSLDGGANVSITGNTMLTGLSEGSHNVIIYANGCGETEKEKVKFTVDTKPPIITIISPEDKATYNQEVVPLKFTINEPVVWIGYSLDGKKNKTIDGNTDLEDLTGGSHNIIVYATDKAGNTGASNKVSFYYCEADADGDKRINSKDVGAVWSAMGSSPGSIKWNPYADLNGDNRIDLMDLVFVLSNYGKTCK